MKRIIIFLLLVANNNVFSQKNKIILKDNGYYFAKNKVLKKEIGNLKWLRKLKSNDTVLSIHPIIT